MLIEYRKYVPLLLILVVYLILQLFDFGRPFNHPFLFALAKFILFVTGIIYALIKKNSWRTRVSISLVFVGLIFGSYYLNAWKLTARLYLNSVEDDYLEAFTMLEKNNHISILWYHESGDSLSYEFSPPGPPDSVIQQGKSAILNYYDNQTFLFSPEDSLKLLNFMKKHSYIELWRDPYGLAFIYNRFIDNRFGVLFCPNDEKCDELDSSQIENKTYIKVKKNWYSYGAV